MAMNEPFDPQRLQLETCVRQVDYHDALDSTSDRALKLAGAEDLQLPLLVLADRQLAGRGRGDNRWWSGDGALTFSLILPKHPAAASHRTATQRETSVLATPRPEGAFVSLGAAIAVERAIAATLPDCELRLKWPNDVYLQRKKVCGVLVESPAVARPVFVTGIGINVNNSLKGAPDEVRARAISMCDAGGRSLDRNELLVRVLREFELILSGLADGSLSLREMWTRACMLQGRQVSVQSGGQITTGLCEGIDDDGNLLIRSGGGLVRCSTGVIARSE